MAVFTVFWPLDLTERQTNVSLFHCTPDVYWEYKEDSQKWYEDDQKALL